MANSDWKARLDIDSVFNENLHRYQMLQTWLRDASFLKDWLLKPEYSISGGIKSIITYTLKYFHLA